MKWHNQSNVVGWTRMGTTTYDKVGDHFNRCNVEPYPPDSVKVIGSALTPCTAPRIERALVNLVACSIILC